MKTNTVAFTKKELNIIREFWSSINFDLECISDWYSQEKISKRKARDAFNVIRKLGWHCHTLDELNHLYQDESNDIDLIECEKCKFDYSKRDLKLKNKKLYCSWCMK